MLRQTPRGFLLDVKATPKASKDEIKGWRGNCLMARVTTVPEGGKANEAIIRLLADSARVPKSAFSLVSGATGRTKTFRLVSHVDVVQAWAEGLPSE